MTVIAEDIALNGPFVPNGETITFPFTFPISTDQEIAVIKDGIEVNPALYTVHRNADNTGHVTFAAAPSGTSMYLLPAPAFGQPTTLRNQGPFYQAAVERALDNLAVQNLWLRALVSKLMLSSFLVPGTLNGRYLSWDADGNPILSNGTGADDALRFDLGQPTGAQIPGFLEEGDGALPSSIATALKRQPLIVENYMDPDDGTNVAPALHRAFAAGVATRRPLRMSKAWNGLFIAGLVEAWPDADGFVPLLDLNGSLLYHGRDNPVGGHTTLDESYGFRIRGLVDGALANAVGGGIINGTIDGQSIGTPATNGIQCVFGSNVSGMTFDRLNGRNMKRGYFIHLFRYSNGGAVTIPNRWSNAVCTGYILTNGSDGYRWFSFSDDGDLSVLMPGDTIADGVTRPIATPLTTTSGNSIRSYGQLTYWTNNTGADKSIPPAIDLTEAALLALGLTKGGTTKVIGGATKSAAVAEYYESGGTRIADGVIRGASPIVENVTTEGGYYGLLCIGNGGAICRNVTVSKPVRCIVGEWHAPWDAQGVNRLLDPISSAFLMAWGSAGWKVDTLLIDASGGRWSGQTLFNFYLSAGNGKFEHVEIITANEVTDGEGLAYFGPHCSGVRGDRLILRGDCIKGFLRFESAWRAATPATEATSPLPEYAGISTIPLTEIEINTVTVVSTSAGAVPAAVAYVQNADIGIDGIQIHNLTAMSALHTRAIKVIEQAAVPATNGVKNLVLEDARLGSIIDTPRARKHWMQDGLKNVTYFDDSVERTIGTTATPDVSLSNRWVLGSSGNITGLVGGVEGHVIEIRGNGTRVLNHALNVDGTAIVLKDGANLTLAADKIIRLRYSTAAVSGGTGGYVEVGV